MLNTKLLKLFTSERVSRAYLYNYAQYSTSNKKLEKNRSQYDVVVIGGGIVGVASARELALRYPKLKIAVVEKEKKLAYHQSGHNSGVIHAGIYYKPGSLKAKLCVEGLNLTYDYLNAKGIPYKKCGKLIVAVEEREIKPLEDLYKRGLANNVRDLEMIDEDEIYKKEPHCEGLQALWSPHTGIVDWALVTENYAKDFRESGGKIFCDFEVNKFKEARDDIEYPVAVCSGDDESIRAKYVLACCGLQSDLVAKLSGCSPNPKIIPFRGEYLILAPARRHLVRGNIYPVPDPRFPFLGVHFTPRMDGSVLLGPNAVLSFQREGYKWSDVNLKDLFEIISYPGFRQMAMRYAKFGFKEMLRSWFIPLQVNELARYIPELIDADVMRGPSGVRAQAMEVDGSLIEDFVFDCQQTKGLIGSRVLHCRNAPSPGATSSLAIAKMIADRMATEFNL